MSLIVISKATVAPPLPFQMPVAPTSWIRTPLPDNAALHPNSAAIVAEIVNQANRKCTGWPYTYSNPAMNITAWSTAYAIIGSGADRPSYKPVTLTKMFQSGGAIFTQGGIPIPDDLVPQADSDSAQTIYEPNWIGPRGEQGRIYEIWGWTKDANGNHSGRQAARMVDCNRRNGRYRDYWWQYGGTYSHPETSPGGLQEGIYEDHNYGTTATGSPPVLTMCINPVDAVRGFCDHAIGLEVIDCGKSFVWPAQRGDGTIDQTINPVIEGMRLRFPADAVMPTNLTPMGQLLWKTVKQYGFMINDKTASCLAVRATPDCVGLLPTGNAFTNFPWGSLQCLAIGNDAVQTPTV